MPGSVEDPRDLEPVTADAYLALYLFSPLFVPFSATHPVRQS
jgi:hypothetical protein